MDAPLFIARRLSLKRGRGKDRRSPAVTIAAVGIALCMAVMMLTIAIVPGFKHEVTRKVMGFDAQISIDPIQPVTLEPSNPRPARLTPELSALITDSLPGADVELAVKLPGILKTDDHFAGLVFEAFSGSEALRFIEENLVEGIVPAYTSSPDSTRYDIVISSHTARELKLQCGSRVDGYFFTNDNLRARRFTVTGIYNSHFNDFDRLLAIMSYPAAASLAEMAPDEGTAIQIRGLAPDEVIPAAGVVSTVLSDAFHAGTVADYLEATDVYQLNPMYFNWLDLLNTNVTVIILLMACVGAATLISCLFIMILERVQLIGTLKALGATNRQVSRIFLYMAERIVIRGIIIGDIIGLSLIALQHHFDLIPLNPESYYLSAVPVEFNWCGFITLNVSVAVISLLVMLLPTMTVSRITPARVMRFE